MAEPNNDLTADYVRSILDYNPLTGEFWRKYWNQKKPAGSGQSKGYRRITIDYSQYYAHRLAWLITYGEWPTDQLDHINGNKLDNRIENLRPATAGQNCQNVGRRRRNSTGFRGVLRFKGRFRGRFMADGKMIDVGYYDTAIETARAVNEAMLKHHGEFARLNVIPGDEYREAAE